MGSPFSLSGLGFQGMLSASSTASRGRGNPKDPEIRGVMHDLKAPIKGSTAVLGVLFSAFLGREIP